MIKTVLALLCVGGILGLLIAFSDTQPSKIYVIHNNTAKEPLEIILERYVPARTAWYSRVGMTPMGYGFSPYEFHLYDTADYYFDEVYTFAQGGETLWHPMVRHLLVENRL